MAMISGEIRPSGPIIVVGREGRAAARLHEIFGRQGWPTRAAREEADVRWAAAIHKPAAVVVVPGAAAWTRRMVATARAATPAAVMVIGPVWTPDLVAALRDGIDAVIDDGAGDDEIVARVLAVLRRTSVVHEPGVRFLVAGGLEVDLWAHAVTLDGCPLRLSPTEYKLLVYLMRHAGRSISATTLVDQIWGWAEADGLNTLRISVGRLRRKLSDDAHDPHFIRSIRGHGYRFAMPVTEQGDDSSRLDQANGQARMLDAASDLAEATAACATPAAAAQLIAATLVDQGCSDAIALFHASQGKLWLIAHEGLSATWASAVSPAIPLRAAYASSLAVKTGQVVQFSHASTARLRMSDTATLLRHERSALGVFLPLRIGGRVYGSMGAVRRTGEPYSPTVLAYLRTVLGLYANCLPRSPR